MAGSMKPNYSDVWADDDDLMADLPAASKQNDTEAEIHIPKKIRDNYKQRKSHHSTVTDGSTMDLQESLSMTPFQTTESASTPSTMKRKKSIKKDQLFEKKEITEEQMGTEFPSPLRKIRRNSTLQASKRNPPPRLKDSVKYEQNTTNGSLNVSSNSYLGLIENMPVKVITEDEWEGANASTYTPSVARPSVKIFALNNGSYTEVTSLSPKEASQDFRAGDTIGPYSSVNPSIGANFGNETPLQLAITVQKGCQLIYTMCHGFLGGIALGYILLTLSIGTATDEIGGFFQVNPAFAKCIQTSFGLLLSVCLVSVLDRYDIRSWKSDNLHHFLQSKSRLIGMVILAIYTSTLVLNTCTVPWDERLGLPPYNNSLWFTPETVEQEIDQWKTLSVFRCTGAILGWILVTFFPIKDLLQTRLQTIYSTRDSSSEENNLRQTEQKY